MVEINDCKELHEAIDSHELCFIKIGASWCNPCKVIQKSIENIEKRHTDIYFISIDAEEADDDIIDEFNIRSVPTTIYIKNGEIISREIGLQTEDQIEGRLV